MLLYCASLNTGKYSLSQTGAYSFETFGVYVSKQSIDERFNASAQSFVKSILSHLVANYISIPLEKSYLSHFERVRIKDSTKFILPDFLKEYYRGTGGNVNTSKAGISIQFEYDMKSSSIVELVLTDGNRNDTTDAKESLDCIGTGDLIIRDLGYCSLTVLEGIKQKKAYFIYRLMPSLSQEQGVTMLTPVKAIKGEEPVITQREKAGRDLFSTAVSKVRQPIESFFNWLNEKTNIQRAMKVRSTSGLLVYTMGKIAIAFICLIF